MTFEQGQDPIAPVPEQQTAPGPVEQAPAGQADSIDVRPASAVAQVPASQIAHDDSNPVDAPVRQSRRLAVVASLRRAFVFALTIGLFAGGVWLGATTFERMRPAPATPEPGSPMAVPPPLIAEQFINALKANDADGIRASMPLHAHQNLTGELSKYSIGKVIAVETLGTMVVGQQSATEIMIDAVRTNTLPFQINLVILVDGGQIEGFR